jgi:glutathionylspermidine synthase
MSRVIESPRDNFESKVKEDGLSFYDLEGLKWGKLGHTDNYWTEEGAIKITA